MNPLRPWLIALSLAAALQSCSMQKDTPNQRQNNYTIRFRFPANRAENLTLQEFGSCLNTEPYYISAINITGNSYLTATIKNIRGDSALNATREMLLNSGLPIQNLTIEHD